MTEQDILPSKAAVFFDLILENKVEDLKQLITGECFEFLQLDLAHARCDDNIDLENLMAVSYRKTIYLSVNDAFWTVGIQTAFKHKNDCLGVLMDYSLAHSDEAALNFVFPLLDLVDTKSGTPEEQMFFDQLDEIFSFIPDGIVGKILELAHPDALSDTHAGQYICSQWANRLKNELTNYGTSTVGKKI